jgi:hypothetical protein
MHMKLQDRFSWQVQQVGSPVCTWAVHVMLLGAGCISGWCAASECGFIRAWCARHSVPYDVTQLNTERRQQRSVSHLQQSCLVTGLVLAHVVRGVVVAYYAMSNMHSMHVHVQACDQACNMQHATVASLCHRVQ